MTIYLLDDDKAFLKEYVNLSKKIEHSISIKAFDNCEQFIDDLLNSKDQPDGVIMDIELGEYNGINIACTLSNKFPKLPIIFVTNYQEKYCQGIFLGDKDFSPFGFITKPLQPEIINSIYSKLHAHIINKSNYVIVKSGAKHIVIDIDEVLYVENDKYRINIHTTNDIITVNEKLNTFKENLPEYFLSSHKSFVVNLKHIKSFNSTDIFFLGGKTVPLSRSKKNDFINNFTYLKGLCKC